MMDKTNVTRIFFLKNEQLNNLELVLIMHSAVLSGSQIFACGGKTKKKNRLHTLRSKRAIHEAKDLAIGECVCACM